MQALRSRYVNAIHAADMYLVRVNHLPPALRTELDSLVLRSTRLGNRMFTSWLRNQTNDNPWSRYNDHLNT